MRQTVNQHFEQLFTESPRYFLLMGGRGAGRSTAASQFALAKLIAPEYFRCAIMRYILGDIRNSIYREIVDRMTENDIADKVSINDSSMVIAYGKNTINAVGFKKSSGDQKSKLKSLANYNCIIIEEADEIGEEEFMQLDDSLRTLKGDIRIIFLFNSPPKSHWIIRRFFNLTESDVKDFYIPSLKAETNAVYIGGTFRDNRKNLDLETVKRYENYKNTKPDYYYQVIQGLVPETVRGKIYSGWQLVDNVPDGARLVKFGLDWGWYPDPVSVIALYYYNGAYYADEVVHGTSIEDEMVAGAIKQVPGWENITVICGADEPKSIELLRKYKIRADTGVKGPGSVAYRIKATASKKMFVTRRSKNIWDGYENYAWDEDKDGNPKGVPSHYLSDTMDAVGYAVASINPISHFVNPNGGGQPRQRTNIAV